MTKEAIEAIRKRFKEADADMRALWGERTSTCLANFQEDPQYIHERLIFLDIPTLLAALDEQAAELEALRVANRLGEGESLYDRVREAQLARSVCEAAVEYFDHNSVQARYELREAANRWRERTK